MLEVYVCLVEPPDVKYSTKYGFENNLAGFFNVTVFVG
jgi:hypothetical protein